MIYNQILSLNYYLFNMKKFLNKILHEKILLIKVKHITNFFTQFKNSFLIYNPFYGVNVNYFYKNIKNNKLNNKKKIRYKSVKVNNVFLYRNFKKYKIPYKDLTYIFNMSIEKLRKSKINYVKNLFNNKKT